MTESLLYKMFSYLSEIADDVKENGAWLALVIYYVNDYKFTT